MKSLQELLYKVPLLEVVGDVTRTVPDFQFDSRQVQPGHLFIAVPGTQADGSHYIDAALAAGAAVIVAEKLPERLLAEVTYIRVKHAAAALAYLATNFYDNPSLELKVIGTTGTNGKTTVSTLLHTLFRSLGYSTGLISTIENKIHDTALPATHTTPDPKALQSLLRKMVQAGCTHVFMEVSSHALVQHRVTGLQFAGAVFTNLTHDHLDYHGSFAAYLKAKQQLFDHLPRSAFALTNLDDRNGHVMVQNSRATMRSYALKAPADYKGRLLENRLDGMLLEVNGAEVWFRLSGAFNAYNLLAIIGTANELGLPLAEILLAASQLTGAKGRFEAFHFPNRITGVVDYAHTPDALKNVLQTLRELKAHSGMASEGRIIVIFGCGGERDAAKRPLMGKIAAELADQIILTSDNPRSEDPELILDAIEAGIPLSSRKKVLRITGRKEAIRAAAHMTRPDDVLLLAGKGHEDYQIIGTERLPFDDRAELLAAFAKLNA